MRTDWPWPLSENTKWCIRRSSPSLHSTPCTTTFHCLQLISISRSYLAGSEPPAEPRRKAFWEMLFVAVGTGVRWGSLQPPTRLRKKKEGVNKWLGSGQQGLLQILAFPNFYLVTFPVTFNKYLLGIFHVPGNGTLNKTNGDFRIYGTQS